MESYRTLEAALRAAHRRSFSEASPFRVVRPLKDLGGHYTYSCQNTRFPLDSRQWDELAIVEAR